MYGIYLHLVDFYGTCKVNIPYMEHMGGIHNTIYNQITVVLPIFFHMKKKPSSSPKTPRNHALYDRRSPSLVLRLGHKDFSKK